MQRTRVNIMYSHSKVTACLSSRKAFAIVVYYNGNGFNISRYRLNREHTLKASSKGSVVVLGMVRGGGWGWRAPFRSTSWTGLGTFFRMAGFIVHLWEWEKWEKFTIVHKTTVVQKVAQKVAIHTSFLLLGNVCTSVVMDTERRRHGPRQLLWPHPLHSSPWQQQQTKTTDDRWIGNTFKASVLQFSATVDLKIR